MIRQVEALIDEHPLRERLHAQRMLALYRGGRQADALNAYREARSVLVDQIGVEPGAELRQLQEAILAQDPALDHAPAAPAQAAPGVRPLRRRAAPVLAVAGLLLFAGVLAFGVSRVTQPDSLSGIAENHVGVIDSGSARITDQYRVGNGPEAVTAGASSVWVANRVDGTVSRIDRGREEVVTIDVGGEPTGLSFGGRSLWVADGQGRTVAQIDPSVNKVVQRFDVGNAAHAVAVGFGAVWVASAVDATVVKIDIESGRITMRIGVEARPTALAAGAGAIWVVSEATAHVIRLDPRSGTPVDSIAVGNGPSGVAVGAGAVWAANRIDGTLYRIDPATERSRRRCGSATIHARSRPTRTACGLPTRATEPSCESIPADRKVTDTVGIQGSPAALAVVDGTIWTAALAATATHRGGTLRVSHMIPMPAEPSIIDPPTRTCRLLHSPTTALSATGGPAVRLAERSSRISPTTCRSRAPGGGPTCSGCGRSVRFSNGAPVKPEDVRASIERLLATPHQDFKPDLPPIRGTARCTGKVCDLSQGIETDAAARTVTIHLSRPDPEFLHKLHIRLHRAGRELGEGGDDEAAAGHGPIHDQALGPAARRVDGPQPPLPCVVARPARRVPGPDRLPAGPATSAGRRGGTRRRGHRPAASRDPRCRSATDALWRTAALRPPPRDDVRVPQHPHPAVR